MTEPQDLDKILKERFAQLPPVIQQAITSADIQKQLRQLAETNKLHLDQWDKLENEVMMTLFGITPMDDLATNIQKHVGVGRDVASDLTDNISKIVFEPIREELERELDNPQAKEAQVSDVEKVGQAILAQEKAGGAVVPAATVAPATPPVAPNTDKAVRAPVSESYRAGETSAARKSIHDDPYRESPV